MNKSWWFELFLKENNAWQRDLQGNNCTIEQFLNRTVVYGKQPVLLHEYTNYRRSLLVSESMQEPSETA